jgi:hypothetical protein
MRFLGKSAQKTIRKKSLLKENKIFNIFISFFQQKNIQV